MQPDDTLDETAKIPVYKQAPPRSGNGGAMLSFITGISLVLLSGACFWTAGLTRASCQAGNPASSQLLGGCVNAANFWDLSIAGMAIGGVLLLTGAILSAGRRY